MFRKLFCAAFLLCSTVVGVCSTANYTVTNLTALTGRQWARAYGVNDLGQVVGMSHDGTNEHAVIWDADGSTTVIAESSSGSCEARSINNHGQVVGYNYWTGGIVWSRDAGLSYITHGWQSVILTSINDSGRIGGYFNTPESYQVAATWDLTGRMTFQATSGGNDRSMVYAMNDSGAMVGSYTGYGTSTHGALWPSGEILPYAGSSSAAYDLNNNGIVVGYASAYSQQLGGTGYSAVKWIDGVAVTLAGPTIPERPSFAYSVNDAGIVVGEYNGLAAIWGADNTMDYLPLMPGCIGGVATGINSSGMAVGYCWDAAWTTMYAVEWNPVATPEPGSLMGLLVGACGVVGLVRRRR